jgi:hypothetical protein
MLKVMTVRSEKMREYWRLKFWRRDQLIKFFAVWLLIALSIFIVVNYLPYGVDWHTVFRPAARALLSLESPYSIEGYYNAPWALLPLIPLAVLPESIGYAFLILLSLAGFSFTAHRLGARPSIIIVLLLSPPVLHCLLNGNIDALSVVGFVLPPQIGLFLVLIKPQIGIVLAMYWLIEVWRRRGIQEVFRTFGPLIVVLLVSFCLFGFWPLRFKEELHLWWNASLWPASIPVGLALLAGAILRNQKKFAMAASPFLSPYVLLHAWVGALIALASRIPETVAAVVGIWILIAVRSF